MRVRYCKCGNEVYIRNADEMPKEIVCDICKEKNESRDA